MPRGHKDLSCEYAEKRYDHQIRKDQMHVVKRLHYIYVGGYWCVPWHITDRDLFEWIDRKDYRLKHSICLDNTHDRPCYDFFGFGGVDRNEPDHHNEQPIDANKVNARCDRHYAVVGNDDTNEI